MLLVNLAGLALIGLIVWWFWLYQPPKTRLSGNELTITVENGVYSPSHIQVQAGKPVQLTFIRKDPSPCAETLLIPKLDISQNLPLNQPKKINLGVLQPGQYDFHCQMQMYRGQITVE